MATITVDRGRTVTVTVSLLSNLAGDTITSDIRVGRSFTSRRIAAWEVDFRTDGADGELVLTLDNSVTALITDDIGYMDIKRVTAGEPVSVFKEPIQVVFRDPITE